MIVTDVWWLPQGLYATFRDRPIFFVASADRWPRLTDRLREAGFTGFLAIVQQPPAHPDDELVDDGMLNFFLVTLRHRDL